MKTIGVLIASARPNRVGAPVAQWIQDGLDTSRWRVEPIDLGALALPAFDEAFSPRQGEPYANAHTIAWAETVRSLDALVIVTPEYNGSIPGALKTAIDYLHAEWNGLPVAVVGYGWHAGSGAIAETERLMGVLGAAVVGSVGLTFREDLEADGTMRPREETRTAITDLVTRLEENATATAA